MPPSVTALPASSPIASAKVLAAALFPTNLKRTVSATFELDWAAGVSDIPARDWDALVDENDPFLEHAFLLALEKSGSVGARAGWRPRFVLVRDAADRRLVGAAPAYLKTHSYGEFIFDWSWAAAAARAGISYYPKLVVAVPFTPVTGQRLLVHPELDAQRPIIQQLLIRGLVALARDTKASSVHVLFGTQAETTALAGEGFAARLSMQFHWLNRLDRPYSNFDDFLSAFRSRNRKQVRKERTVAASHGLRLTLREGPELTSEDWEALEGFYEANIEKHDGARYLTPAFFREIRRTFAHRVVATLAYRPEDRRPVAGTINFERGRHLYGRYWGCLEEREMLHFELCYYQLIDRAVQRGYTRFEAGAQGEHKLKRGLDPAATHSAHLLLHPGLHAAIARFVQAEAAAVEQELGEYRRLSPYARTAEPAAASSASESPGSAEPD